MLTTLPRDLQGEIARRLSGRNAARLAMTSRNARQAAQPVANAAWRRYVVNDAQGLFQTIQGVLRVHKSFLRYLSSHLLVTGRRFWLPRRAFPTMDVLRSRRWLRPDVVVLGPTMETSIRYGVRTPSGRLSVSHVVDWRESGPEWILWRFTVFMTLDFGEGTRANFSVTYRSGMPTTVFRVDNIQSHPADNRFIGVLAWLVTKVRAMGWTVDADKVEEVYPASVIRAWDRDRVF